MRSNKMARNIFAFILLTALIFNYSIEASANDNYRITSDSCKTGAFGVPVIFDVRALYVNKGSGVSIDHLSVKYTAPGRGALVKEKANIAVKSTQGESCAFGSCGPRSWGFYKPNALTYKQINGVDIDRDIPEEFVGTLEVELSTILFQESSQKKVSCKVNV